jgi:hypothetical protein
MSDLQNYIEKRKARDSEFAKDFDAGYEQFKIGVMLKQARQQAGYTQEELAARLHTKKTAISRIENHAEDILGGRGTSFHSSIEFQEASGRGNGTAAGSD